jgi:O-antigen/teichoic acid export membrane protein
VAVVKTLFETTRRPGAAKKRRTASVLRLARQVGGRLSWGIADQGMSSLTNFAVSIYIAKTLGAVQFGAFSLSYVTYALALQASRGLTTDPLLVRFSHTDLPTWRRAVAICTGAAVLTGLATGACALVAAALLHGPARLAFFALGLTLPGLLLQDSWRFAFFALGRGGQAFLNDTIWGVTLLPALVLLRKTGHANVFWFVFAWGATAALGAAIGPLQARVIPRLRGSWDWLTRTRDLGFRYLVEGTAPSAANQLRNSFLTAILGLAALGALQAANTLMGLLQVAQYGLGLVAVPEAARLQRRSRRHMALFCALISVGLTTLALCWGVALLVALPRGLGDKLLGPLWRPTYLLVLPTTFFVAGTCASAGAGTWLHVLGAARRSMRASTVTVVIYLVLSLGGAVLGGTVWTVRCAALGTWIGAGVFWWQVRAAQREYDTALAGNQASPSDQNGQDRGISEPAARKLLPFDLEVPPDPVPRAAAFKLPIPADRHTRDGAPARSPAPLAVPYDPAPWAIAFAPSSVRLPLLPTAADQLLEDRSADALPEQREHVAAPPPWREKMPSPSPGRHERRIRRRVSLAWGLLVLNALGYTGALVHIPGAIGKGITQGALPLAIIVALSVNRRVNLRPNVYLCLVTLLAIEAFVPIMQPTHFGTIYRVVRFAEFVVALWLLTPWWGRRDLMLVRCYLTSLTVILASVGVGVLVAPGKALGGRLSGVLWDIPPTQVAHYAAVTTGLVVILWACGRMRGRPTLLVVTVTIGVLLATHTRTALVAMTAGLLVAGLSLIAGNARVRKLFAATGAAIASAIMTLSSVIVSFLARGEGTSELTDLTGRTLVWGPLLNFPRDKFQEIFGFGLSNDAFNGLPIDSNWLASYSDQGLFGVFTCAAILIFLLVTAYFQPRGVQRALALFLITYCLVASFTEVGFTNVNPYLLELTLAASLLVPPATGTKPT